MCGINRVKVVSVMYEVFKGLNVQRTSKDMIGICVIYEGLKNTCGIEGKKNEKEGLKGCQ